MLMTIAIAVGIVALAMLGLSIGFLLTGRCIRGTCGGEKSYDAEGNPLQCPTCPNKDKQETSSS